ncbi:hypothetical protein LCGC14_2110620 [marine sediment metagenome]|uniref:Uncharacterized protein n=1 Tax=marine sediment metagenome TaxID=412755 RepID=A0A0F9E7A8_9ZZZZ
MFFSSQRIVAVVVAIMVLMFVFGMMAGLNLPLVNKASCPPQIEASTRVRLFFAELPPELTEQDMEFSEVCGLNWEDPVRIAPLDQGV